MWYCWIFPIDNLMSRGPQTRNCRTRMDSLGFYGWTRFLIHDEPTPTRKCLFLRVGHG